MICLKHTVPLLTFIGGVILSSIALFFANWKYRVLLAVVLISLIFVTIIIYLIANVISLRSDLSDSNSQLKSITDNRDGLIEQLHAKNNELKLNHQETYDNKLLMLAMYDKLSKEDRESLVALSNFISSNKELK